MKHGGFTPLCSCGWVNDPKRATKLHAAFCPVMLYAENERLRALLERIVRDGRPWIESQGDRCIEIPARLLDEIRAALAAPKG